jgi:hypothetical protein
MKECCCGNVLDDRPSGNYRTVMFPCQCEKPGPKRKRPPKVGPHDYCSKEQYEQRTKAGLPVMAEVEKAVAEEWK